MKLLKNRAATIAALIGVGYALAEMRGKRDYKIDTMRSNVIGEFGAYACRIWYTYVTIYWSWYSTRCC